MKRIFKIIGVSILSILSILAITVFILYSNFKKLETVDIENTFVRDSIPFYYSSTGHILIDVEIQDSKKTYPFILDSGASNMIFTPNTSIFNFENNGFDLGKGANGKYFFTRIKKVNRIKIQSLIFKNFNVSEVNHNFDCMENIYGIIGLGLMHNLNWQIDFQNKMIIVNKDMTDFNFSKERIELLLNENRFSHHLYLPLQLSPQGSLIRVNVDLGNNGNLSLKESEVVKDSLELKTKNIKGTQLTGLGEDNYTISNEKEYITDKLILDLSYEVANFPFSTNTNSLNLLGLGFFKKFKTTISWSNKLLILEPYDDYLNFIDKTFGFDIKYDENGDIIINSIIEDTPASKNKLPLYSKVIAVNDIHNIKKIDLCILKEIIKSNDTINLKLKKNDIVRKYQLVKETIF